MTGTTDRVVPAASAAPSTVRTTGTHATRVLGAVTLVGVALLLLFGLWLSPADINQGDSVRILYLHAPSAWVAYLAFVVTALAFIAPWLAAAIALLLLVLGIVVVVLFWQAIARYRRSRQRRRAAEEP